ncbi:MAG TPA: PQQ-binding-like beta-propeller repeat protein [Pseudoduganella sp.]
MQYNNAFFFRLIYMHPVLRGSAALWMVLAIAACGGGGSSGGGASSVNATSAEGGWLSFSPNSVEVSTYEGESIPFAIKATSSRTFSNPFNIGIVDTSGTITTEVELTALNQMMYSAKLKTAPQLTAGTHTANLEVRLCEDSPLTCSKPLPGSPWRVPLKVSVKTAAEAAKRLALSVQSLQATTYRYDQAAIRFTGAFTGDLTGLPIRIGIFDKGNISDPAIIEQSGGAFTASVMSSHWLAEGEYSSNLEIRVCRDDPKICSLPVVGSPWTLPFKLTVKSATNLTPLKPVAGLGPWTSYQGGAAHTGYVDASFDTANFLRRFEHALNGQSPSYNSVAIDNGVVFVSRSTNEAFLMGIRESDGSTTWSTYLGTVSRINPPAAANGQVYVTTTAGLYSTFWIFDQQTGKILSRTPVNSQLPTYRMPTIYGADVYAADGLNGGMSKFSSSTLGKLWSKDISQFDLYTPAVDANHAYGFALGTLRALNTGDGQTSWQVEDQANSSGTSYGRAVALYGKYAIVVYAGRLMAYDTTTHALAWSASNNIVGQPAVGNGLIYAAGAAGTVLEARNIADGQLQWSSEKLGVDNVAEVIATRNLAFVTGDRKTVAVDLTTHKVVWSYPEGGTIAISSNGVLYILSPSAVSAINLQ